MTCKSSRKRAQSYEFLSKSIAEVEERPLSARAKRIRAIGLNAFYVGGIDLMSDLFWCLEKQGVRVGGYWDGIGGWYR